MVRPTRAGGPGDGGVNTLRAVVVIVLMVVVGVIVLAKMDKGTSSTVATRTTTHHRSGSSPTTSPPPATTTTTVVPPAQIKVQVLNGLLTGSLAGQWNTKLKSLGYQTGVADNATVKTTQSAIYVLTPGYAAEANALAQAVGLPVTAVNPTVPPPSTAPIPAAERTTANLVLVIGNELASSA